MRFFVTFLLLFLGNCYAVAQQEASFSKYKFNPLVFNPAYAGSHEHLSLNLVYRKQWLGFEGAPRSQFFAAHTPLKRENIGIGMSLSSDKIGATGRFNCSFAYAYRMNLANGYKLAAGIHAGVSNWHSDWFNVTVQQGSDAVFTQKDSRWMPNLGAGLYLSNRNFYVGFSCPSLLEFRLRDGDKPETDLAAKSYRHYYAMVGGLFTLNEKSLVFRPSMLIKNTSLFSRLRKDENYRNIGSPTEVDLDAALIFNQTFWVGTGIRQPLELGSTSGGAADIWAAWQLYNGMRFGASYDIVLSPIRSISNSSFELMLGWEFDIKVRRAASIRYF